MQYTRVVIKEHITLNAVFELAWEEDWELYNIIPSSETDPFEKVWITNNGRTGIHYIQDPMINLHYYSVEGEDRETIVNKIRATLDIYTDDDIRQMIQNAVKPEEHIRAVYHAGIAAPQDYSIEHFGYITRAMSHPDPQVRYAAVFMCGFVAWRELREPLERLRDNDSSSEVKELAAVVINSLSKHNWNDNLT